MAELNFTSVDDREPHLFRRLEMIKKYPEIRTLFGTNPWTLAITIVLIASQFGIAFLVADQPWWLILLAAWGVGAFIDHALFVVMHECAHNLVFARSAASKLVGILANSSSVFPSSIGFRNYHLLHHQYQGEVESDADLSGPVESNLVRNSWWRKGLWLLVYPIVVGIVRPARVNKVALFEPWALFNLVVTVGAAAAVTFLWGWGALAYLALSLFASIGLHPVGARWIQEHYVVKEGQETYSYYGPNNRVALNVGFHNEHHDFMMIPWNNLPKLKRMAPSYYDSLYSHKSYTRLLFRFLFDKDLSLYSRLVREDRTTRRRKNLDSRDTEKIIETQAAQAHQNPAAPAVSVPSPQALPASSG